MLFKVFSDFTIYDHPSDIYCIVYENVVRSSVGLHRAEYYRVYNIDYRLGRLRFYRVIVNIQLYRLLSKINTSLASELILK